ncbi:MAG: class I SAM-dependent rRNA methyltransferase [Planctomycetota bacterium]|nr:class I SAM-dependent rRNA methyltransferase [Planctomycetota bacterium]
MPTVVVLKRGKAGSILQGYPWVFEGWIARIKGEIEDGQAVDVLDWREAFVARGVFNRASKIRLRIFSRERDTSFDRNLLATRLDRAIRLREDVLALREQSDAYRIVHSDGDGLPGLVVDRYGDLIVAQISSLAIERLRDDLIEILQDRLSPAALLERQDERARRWEGLAPSEGMISGTTPAGPVEIREGGVRFLLDPTRGQKTGFFLDQRDNRAAAARYARGARVLDGFCFTGAFGIVAAARGGASSIYGFDSSAGAVSLAQRNAALNGIESAVFEKRDAFEELRRLAGAGERFDMVILDPPKFSPTRKDRDVASRAYREVNLQALRMLSPGGILVSCSCSAAIVDYALEAVVASAARDAGREIQILERRGQGPDHPVPPGFPEGRYLTCLILRAH